MGLRSVGMLAALSSTSRFTAGRIASARGHTERSEERTRAARAGGAGALIM